MTEPSHAWKHELKQTELDQPRCVSVIIQRGSHVAVATASIDHVGDYWWVSRVVVKKPHRGQGLGSRCLNRAVELVRQKSEDPIIVTPGGYDIPYEEQEAFYASQGFINKGEGVMEFKGASKDNKQVQDGMQPLP